MFCRIYVGINIDQKILLLSISKFLGIEPDRNAYIEKNGYSIEVRPNDEFDEKRMNTFPDGFLYFPLFVEIDIEDDINQESTAEEVGGILKFLWANKYPAIASCDFEDLLPEKGGYKSRIVPWP